MSFASPWWLLLLVPVAVMVVAYAVQQRRRSRYAVRFASLPMLERLVPHRPEWRRHLPAAILLAALALLAIAVARPQAQVRVPRDSATVIVAIDVSISMRATDVQPSRVEAAARAATRFVRGLPDGFNVGLVVFSGQTAVRAAPTTDRAEVESALQDLTLSARTAIGEGVFTSLDEIRTTATRYGARKVPATVVLLSDGTNTVGRSPAEAAAAARSAGVPVSTIAYGTPDGTVDLEGVPVPVPVDRETLAALAQDTGGRAYTAETAGQLNHVYSDIQSAIGFRTEHREITQWLAGAALLLGLLAAALSLRWFSRLP